MPMKMEQTECSKLSTHKIQMPGNYPEESIQHSEHSGSLKSRRKKKVIFCPLPHKQLSFTVPLALLLTSGGDLKTLCKRFLV